MTEIEEKKHRYAVDKAKRRGDVALEWFKTHKLTPETMPEFQALMKRTNKEFDKMVNLTVEQVNEHILKQIVARI